MILLMFMLVVMLALGIIDVDKFQIFHNEESIICEKAYGDVIFYIGNTEKLRIAESGVFYVDGREVSIDKEVYSSFREWVIEHKGDLRVIK